MSSLAMLRNTVAKRTIEQKATALDFPKAGELIEIRGTGELSLHDRRVLNLLYENAGQQLCDGIKHRIAIAALRGTHKGGERVRDSIIRLMRTIVQVPTKGSDGKPATSLTALLSDTTVCDDDDSPTGEVVYTFSDKMREIVKESTHWGRVRGSVMFAFTSKYSLALYELISMRINRQQWQETFSVEELRELLGVPKGKLTTFKNFHRWGIRPAEIEVNGLADFGVKIEPVRLGGTKRGAVTSFRLSWWQKDVPALKEAFAEIKRAKVGRLARLSGKVEIVEAS